MQTNPMTLNHGAVDGIFAVIADALAVRPTPTPIPRELAQPAASSATGWWQGLLDRFDGWAWRQHQREVEAYLAKSADVYDLEARIRDLERGARCLYS